MTPEKLFQTVDNLPGINGTFCLEADGRLLSHTLKAPFDRSIFNDLVPRVRTLFEAVKESDAPLEEFILEFEGYFLYLRRGLRDRTIGVVASERPNLVALRVSCNLIFKQLPEAVAPLRGSRSTTAVQQPAEEQAPARRSFSAGLNGPLYPTQRVIVSGERLPVSSFRYFRRGHDVLLCSRGLA